MGLPVHSPCVDMCSCESPRTVHTRDANRAETWIKNQPHFRAVSLTPPPALSRPPSPSQALPVWWLSKSTLPHRYSERIGVYGVFATCPTRELPSECSRFHFYYKSHEQLRRHLPLVQTVMQAKATLKRRWPKQILLTLFINPFRST